MQPAGRDISVLLVDDEPLISIDLCDTLIGAGYEVIGPASTVEAAMSLLEWGTPRYAVIDVKVRDGSCLELARRLRRQNVPFVVHTGYPTDTSEPLEVSQAPRLLKPASPIDLLNAIVNLSVMSVRDELQPNGPNKTVPAPALTPGSIR